MYKNTWKNTDTVITIRHGREDMSPESTISELSFMMDVSDTE